MTELETAVAALRAGKLAVIPTDTVYGIAALPEIRDAVEAIFAAKGRPPDKPLPVLGTDKTSLRHVARIGWGAEKLIDHYWPGPLTLVLERATGFDHFLGGDDKSVAVRVPESDVARSLLAKTGPLAVTSANRSGAAPATTVAEAQQIFGSVVEVYVDGGAASGEPSTVVSLLGEPDVLREAAISAKDIMKVLVW
ncbi:MAG TPA: L-threonylcarbamoyladenylate synthase [Actinomycetota bacterium]|nr:L-threonylcarbamoyladenylate synthase [Actinomycetota bacterium]